MRRISIALLLVVAVLMPTLTAESAAFSGTCAITGMNPRPRDHAGTVTITPRGSDVFEVTCSIAGLTYTGVGVAWGNSLAVAYSNGDRSWMGVMNCPLRADGSLEGRWAVQGRAGRPGSETAVRK